MTSQKHLKENETLLRGADGRLYCLRDGVPQVVDEAPRPVKKQTAQPKELPGGLSPRAVMITASKADARGVMITNNVPEARGVMITNNMPEARGVMITNNVPEARGVMITNNMPEARGVMITGKTGDVTRKAG